MSIILYSDEDYKKYKDFSYIVYNNEKVSYPSSADSGVVDVLDGYSIVYGIPIMIKYNSEDCAFNCIDIISSMADRCGAVPCKDFLNTLKKIDHIQKKAIWADINSKLSLKMMKLMDEELSEYYDRLLYLYITNAESLVDYTNNWKENQEDELFQEFMPLYGEVYMFKNIITTNIMAKRQKRKPPYFNNRWCYTMIHNAEHELKKIY